MSTQCITLRTGQKWKAVKGQWKAQVAQEPFQMIGGDTDKVHVHMV